MQADFSFARQFQSFNSVEEMDKSIKHFRYEHRHEIPDSVDVVLDFLSGHSCKIPGVSWVKIPTIVRGTGLSRSTVYRTLKKLEELEILTRIHQFRKDRGQDTSLYVIRPFVSPRLIEKEWKEPVTPGSDTPPVTPPPDSDTCDEDGDFAASDCPETQSLNPIPSGRSNYVYVKDADPIDQIEKLDASYAPRYIPKDFVQLISRYYDDAHKIKKLWDLTMAAHRRYGIDFDWDIVTEAIQTTVLAYKDGHIRKEFTFYYWGTIEQLCGQASRCEPDWDALYDLVAG